MAVSAEEVEDMVLYQVGALAAIAASEGVRLQHVKPHGALYNMAVKDRGAGGRDRAGGRARSTRRSSCSALPGSELAQAGDAAGLRVAARGIRRSRVRSRRIADAADASRRCHSRRLRTSSAAPCGWRATVSSAPRTAATFRCASTPSARTATRPASHELTRQLRAGLEADGIDRAAPLGHAS